MPSTYNIPILEKTIAVIKCISENNSGVTLSEISKQTEAPKSTVFRILYTLESELIIEKKNDRYFLGSMLIHFGLHTLSQREVKTIAAPSLTLLMEETGETAHIAIPVGMQSMILDVVLTTHPIRFSSPVGSLFPLYCTSHGKVFLAFSEKKVLDEYLDVTTLNKRTGKTLTTRKALVNELEKIRMQGFSMDELEFTDDTRCCAVPIFDHDGKCIAALGITSTTITFTKDRIDEISSAIKKYASRISEELGYST